MTTDEHLAAIDATLARLEEAITNPHVPGDRLCMCARCGTREPRNRDDGVLARDAAFLEQQGARYKRERDQARAQRDALKHELALINAEARREPREGGVAGAAGISAEERLLPYLGTREEFASTTRLVRADTAAHIANEHARAVTARAEKAEAQVKALRDALAAARVYITGTIDQLRDIHRDIERAIGPEEWESMGR
jgi:hypothetical protein